MFEIISPSIDANEYLAHANIESAKPRMTDGGPRKIVLPSECFASWNASGRKTGIAGTGTPVAFASGPA
jgi:hypothetical protein